MMNPLRHNFLEHALYLTLKRHSRSMSSRKWSGAKCVISEEKLQKNQDKPGRPFWQERKVAEIYYLKVQTMRAIPPQARVTMSRLKKANKSKKRNHRKPK